MSGGSMTVESKKALSLSKLDRQSSFELLVDELMKDKPDVSTVKTLSNSLGIPYFLDSGKMMGSVLDSANRVYLGEARKKQKEGSL